MSVERQEQGLAGPPNPMQASEETPEERLARWRKLRGHLRDKGLDEVPSDYLLLKPEPTTRPNVGLIAHYTEIDQESLGNNTVADLATVTLAAVAVVFSFTTGMQGSLVLFLVLGAVLMRRITRLLDLMVARKDSLNLTPEELSLSLPGRNRHTKWGAVYSTAIDQRRKRVSRRWPWVGVRKEPCVRVELDDGVVAWLYVCADECKPLADLMTDFLLCARNGGRPLRDHAAAPELATRTSPLVEQPNSRQQCRCAEGEVASVTYKYGDPPIGMALGVQPLFSGDDADWRNRWERSEPAAAATLWRYMSFAKLCSLLERRELFFSLVGDMEDRYEGFIWPSPRSPGDRLQPAERQGVKLLREIVRTALINCWAESEHESALMWKTYAGAEGVAVRTTFQDLKESIRSGAKYPVSIGQVEYVDYSQQQVPRFGWAPLFHKRVEYRGEEEVRAMLPAPPWDTLIDPDVGAIHLDPDVSEQRGRYVPVDLDILVKQVVVSPQAAPGFAEVVKSAVQRSAVGACVITSTI